MLCFNLSYIIIYLLYILIISSVISLNIHEKESSAKLWHILDLCSSLSLNSTSMFNLFKSWSAFAEHMLIKTQSLVAISFKRKHKIKSCSENAQHMLISWQIESEFLTHSRSFFSSSFACMYCMCLAYASLTQFSDDINICTKQSSDTDEKNRDKDKHDINFTYAQLTYCINCTQLAAVDMHNFTRLARK